MGKLRRWFEYSSIATVHYFCNTLLVHLCLKEGVMTLLWPLLLDKLIQRSWNLVENVRYILRIERSGNIHYFGETLDKSRSDRSRNRLGTGVTVHVSRKAPLSNVEHIVRDIHDILKSYYEVARKGFVDNVCIQGTDYHHTPLRVCSPQSIVELSAERLEAVAGKISHPSSNLKAWRSRLKAQKKEGESSQAEVPGKGAMS